MIRQFDVVANPDSGSRDQVPFIAVLQSHLLYGVDTVVVAPLMRPTVVPPDGVIALDVELGDERLTLNMALIANISLKRLGSSVANLARNDYEIRRALDRLFTGF